MQPMREIQRLLTGVLVMLSLIGGLAGYWAVAGPDTILEREDNPRLVEKRASIVRGDIIDRNGRLLVTSAEADDGLVSREYHHPSMYSALGYFSLRYGEGGAEASFNAILNGDARTRGLRDFFNEDLLHLPRHGADVRLTFDSDIQDRVAELMNGYRGAAVVLSVPDGAVLALLSLPTFDPNTLDRDWETLREAEGYPFFNRALQGNYQPGGAMYTLLLGAALLNGVPLDTVYTSAGSPVHVADVVLRCAVEPASDTLTLAEAYAYGCPAPFAQMIDQIGTERIGATTDLFFPASPVTLIGFVAEPVKEANEIAPEATGESASFAVDDALGQGERTFSPMQLAAITVALLDEGNLPQPYALLETRLPGEETWIPAERASTVTPLVPEETARQIKNVMRQAVSGGNAKAAARNGIDIGGQTAYAYSGDETLVWFFGFAQTDDGTGFAVAVVIENNADIDLVAFIGGDALQAAVNAR